MNERRRILYHGGVVDLGLETARLPGGRDISLEIVRHRGGSSAAAVDDQQRVCLLRQYRHAAGDWIWELPAGKPDDGEAALCTAQRELEEEAGVRATDWQTLGDILTTPGFCDEVIQLFLARRLQLVAPRPEAYELIERHWITWSTAQQWALDGTLRDTKTVIGLLRAASLLALE